MKVVRLLLVLTLLLTAVLQSATFASNTTSIKSFGQLPLYFEPNRGQTNAEARFVAHGQGYSLFLTPSEAVLSLRSLPKREDALQQSVANKDVRSAVLRFQLLNSTASPKISGRGRCQSRRQ